MRHGRFHHPIHHHQLLTPPPIDHTYTTPTQPQPHGSDHERKLVEEVLYLHSLWHRGPPSSSSSHLPTPPHLRPTHTTQFKTKKKPPQSDKEWPVDEPKPTSDGPAWPAFKPRNQPVSRPAIGSERDRLVGVRIQLKGVETCASLFRRRDGDEEEEEEEEEDDGDDEDEVEFFEGLFEGDDELKGFYVKNCLDGEFYCLMCGVIGNKLGRRFKSCVSLVQHSVSISKTKKKKAHRAYGKVVCKVLGWDIDRLPSLVAHGEGGTGQSSAKSCEVQDEVKNHVDENSAAVPTREADITSQSQVEAEATPDVIVKDNSTIVGAKLVTTELLN